MLPFLESLRPLVKCRLPSDTGRKHNPFLELTRFGRGSHHATGLHLGPLVSRKIPVVPPLSCSTEGKRPRPWPFLGRASALHRARPKRSFRRSPTLPSTQILQRFQKGGKPGFTLNAARPLHGRIKRQRRLCAILSPCRAIPADRARRIPAGCEKSSVERENEGTPQKAASVVSVSLAMDTSQKSKRKMDSILCLQSKLNHSKLN